MLLDFSISPKNKIKKKKMQQTSNFEFDLSKMILTKSKYLNKKENSITTIDHRSSIVHLHLQANQAQVSTKGSP